MSNDTMDMWICNQKYPECGKFHRTKYLVSSTNKLKGGKGELWLIELVASIIHPFPHPYPWQCCTVEEVYLPAIDSGLCNESCLKNRMQQNWQYKALSFSFKALRGLLGFHSPSWLLLLISEELPLGSCWFFSLNGKNINSNGNWLKIGSYNLIF